MKDSTRPFSLQLLCLFNKKRKKFMLTILVIDDEKPTLSMFRLFLTAYGYRVLTAEDGESGLAIFKRELPEIVFTDLKMPGMDGLEVLKKIRGTGLPAQVVIITGHGDVDRAMEALDLDASDFINKPLEKEALDSALHRAERRIKGNQNNSFKLVIKSVDRHLLVNMSGRLSGKSYQSLAEMENKTPDFDTLTLCFDTAFSVNQEGLRVLMVFLTRMRDKEIQVRLEGLSYNYCRFFQMAGIHKLCDLAKAEALETI